MQKEIKEASSAQFSIKLKVKGYADLLKLRLSALVVVSAILGYFIAPGEADLTAVVYLFLGGFLVTGASNALNQVWERDLDKLMSRTQNRPIPTGVLNVKESLFFAVCWSSIYCQTQPSANFSPKRISRSHVFRNNGCCLLVLSKIEDTPRSSRRFL